MCLMEYSDPYTGLKVEDPIWICRERGCVFERRLRGFNSKNFMFNPAVCLKVDGSLHKVKWGKCATAESWDMEVVGGDELESIVKLWIRHTNKCLAHRYNITRASESGVFLEKCSLNKCSNKFIFPSSREEGSWCF